MTDDQQPPEPSQSDAARPSFQVRIPLEWDEDDGDCPILYANQVMVSHVGPEFFLTFGVVLPPTSGDQLPDALRIQPQVRVAVAREAMPAFVKAISESLQRFRHAQQAAQRQGGAGGPQEQSG